MVSPVTSLNTSFPFDRRTEGDVLSYIYGCSLSERLLLDVDVVNVNGLSLRE